MGVKIIDSSSIHNVNYDFDTKQSSYAHHAKLTDGMYIDDSHAYHLTMSAYPGNSDAVKLYDNPIYMNYDGAVIATPTMADKEHAIWAMYLPNKILQSTDVSYSVYDNQANYSLSLYPSRSEYEAAYNTQRQHIRSARLALDFNIEFYRLPNRGKTPSFDSTKPIARISKIFGKSLYDSSRINPADFDGSPVIVGPTYVVGSVVYWITSNAQTSQFPFQSRRDKAHEMFFYIDLSKWIDQTAGRTGANANPNYGNIYLVNNNCIARFVISCCS